MHIRPVTARDGEGDRVIDLYVAEGKSMDRVGPMKSSSKALRPARTGLRNLAHFATCSCNSCGEHSHKDSDDDDDDDDDDDEMMLNALRCRLTY